MVIWEGLEMNVQKKKMMIISWFLGQLTDCRSPCKSPLPENFWFFVLNRSELHHFKLKMVIWYFNMITSIWPLYLDRQIRVRTSDSIKTSNFHFLWNNVYLDLHWSILHPILSWTINDKTDDLWTPKIINLLLNLSIDPVTKRWYEF